MKMLSARHDKPVNQAFCGVRKCYLVKLPEFGASLLILKRDQKRAVDLLDYPCDLLSHVPVRVNSSGIHNLHSLSYNTAIPPSTSA